MNRGFTIGIDDAPWATFSFFGDIGLAEPSPDLTCNLYLHQPHMFILGISFFMNIYLEVLATITKSGARPFGK